MRHLPLLLASFLTGITLSARTLSISDGRISYVYAASTEEMTFGADNTLTIGKRTFALSDFPIMTVTDDITATENSVEIIYNGTSASVTINGNIAEYGMPTSTARMSASSNRPIFLTQTAEKSPTHSAANPKMAHSHSPAATNHLSSSADLH